MTAEQLRNSILQEAISGRLVSQDPNDEPASILLERLRKDFAELVKSKKIILSKPEKKAMMVAPKCDYDLPENWSWCTLCDISRVYGRIGFRGYTKLDLVNKKEDGAISLSPSNMKNGALDFSSCTYISNAKYEESPEIMVGNDDILIVKTGSSYGKVSHVTNLPWKSTINPQIAIIKEIRVNTKYLFYALQSPNARNKYEEFVLGTSIPTFSQENLLSMSVPLPPLAEQKRIVAKLEELLPIVEQYGKAQKELDELNAALPARLRNSILQVAMQGKLTEHDLEDNWAKVYCEKLPKLKYKSSPEWPQENPFELPENWEWCRIGDICELMNGYAFKSTQYKETGVRVIRITNVQDGYIVDNNPKFYPQIPDIERYALKEGDLLMSLTGNVGRVGILPQSMLPAALNQRVACLRLKDERLKPFLFWYLRCPIFRERCEDSGHGMAQLNISTEWVKQEYIPLPPLAEQQRIVAKIEELFAEIDKMK